MSKKRNLCEGCKWNCGKKKEMVCCQFEGDREPMIVGRGTFRENCIVRKERRARGANLVAEYQRNQQNIKHPSQLVEQRMTE